MAVPATSAASCRLQRLESVPLRDDGGFLSIPATTAGQPIRLMIDTGSDAGLLTPQAASRFRLAPDPDRHVRIQGTGGTGRSAPIATLPALAIGGLLLGDVSMPIGSLPAAPNLAPPVAGFLGGDVLSRFDLDIDVPNATLAFYRVDLPSLACATPPAWNGAYATIPLTRHGVRLSLGATLDGHPISALVDTGARSRLLSQAAGRRIGVPAAALAADPGGIDSGVDMHEQVYHWHVFKSLVIGGETALSPTLTVAPLSAEEPFDMLLGTDWLAGHEVWISYSTGQMFRREAAARSENPR